MIRDVTEASFERDVIERSHELPVVVDFWAEWCGPCRQLGPALEAEAGRRDGEVDLAKVDTDANQALAIGFGIRGIPAVKAFRDGQVVSEFTGAIPLAQVKQFFDSLVPSEADRLAGSESEADLRRALELDPRQAEAAARLSRILLRRGDNEEAAELLGPFGGDFLAEGLAARAALASADGSGDGESVDLSAAFTAWDDGRHAEALERLQEAVAAAEGESRDLLRKVMVAIFTELGPESELAREHRRRLAATLV